MLLIPRPRCRPLCRASDKVDEIFKELLSTFALPVRTIVLWPLSLLKWIRHVPVSCSRRHRVELPLLERGGGGSSKGPGVGGVHWR